MSQGFENWTERDVHAHNARLSKQPATGSSFVPVEEEKTVRGDIIRAAKVRGWLALYGSTAEATGRVIGEWDMVILAEYPRLFLVECKDREGKVTPEQAALAAWARKLGWSPTVCRSIGEFWAYVATAYPSPNSGYGQPGPK